MSSVRYPQLIFLRAREASGSSMAPCSFRIELDIFAFAFPILRPNGPGTSEVFQVLYGDLTEGYQLTGHCGDLGKVNYTEKERLKYIVPLLKWRDGFIGDITKYSLTNFALSPSLTQLFNRSQSELSYQYWGSTPYTPKPTYTAMQNFALLSRGQWESLAAKKNGVFNLTKLWIERNNDIYHDYRKLARYAVNFITSSTQGFPQLVIGNITAQLNIFGQLGHDMGAIHDAIVAYYYYNSTGNFRMAEEKIALIEKLWPIQQQWTIRVNLLGQIQTVLDNLLAARPQAILADYSLLI